MDYFLILEYPYAKIYMKKKEGFEGEEAIVLPRRVVQQSENLPLVKDLHITDIGYYPRASHHYRERKQGAGEHILIYCVDGYGGGIVERKKYLIGPNQYLVVPEKLPHIYWASEEHPWSIYWAHFKGRLGDYLCRQLYLKQQRGGNLMEYNEDLVTVFRNIYQNLQLGYSKQSMEYIALNFSGFLGSFIYNDKFNILKTKNQQDVIDRSIVFLKQHIDKPLSLKEIAAFAHLSVSHFSNLFHKKTGFPPVEYFNHLKMQKACQLLHFSSLRVYEIAAAIGISDPYYFSRLFKESMGLSPKAYRQKWKIK